MWPFKTAPTGSPSADWIQALQAPGGPPCLWLLPGVYQACVPSFCITASYVKGNPCMAHGEAEAAHEKSRPA